MKTKVVIAILLLLMAISTIYASEDPTELTREQLDKAEIQRFKERFESSVNAEGKVEYQPDQHKWIMFEGKILDIPLYNLSDSTGVRLAFSAICNRVLPFSSAKSWELQPTKISLNPKIIQTDYVQYAHGYPVLKGGRISIYYYPIKHEFLIGNSTVIIPDTPTSVHISMEEAISFASHQYPELRKTEQTIEKSIIAYVQDYTNQSNNAILCYVISLDGYWVHVDVNTGKVLHRECSLARLYTGQVTGDYYGDDYITLPSPNTGSHMPNIDITTSGVIYNTNDLGCFTLDPYELPSLYSTLSHTPQFYLVDYNTSQQFYGSTPVLDGNYISIHYYDDLQHNPNIYYHTEDQIMGLESEFFNPRGIPIDLCVYTGSSVPLDSGCFEAHPNGSQSIHIKSGYGIFSQVPRHEVSHSYVYNSMRSYFFWPPTATYPDEYAAMDEALAIYLPCAVIGSPNCNYNCDQQYTPISDAVTVEFIRQHFYPGVPATSLNEEDYSAYMMGYPIASALWAIRAGFADLSEFNDAISYVINQIGEVASANVNTTYRHKPRYFYNLLMNEVATIGQTTGLNDKQRAIDAAYSSRGLHFNPKVESVSSMNKTRNIFRLNEPVHVKVSNCPQNTRLNIYVIKHNDYTYLDGALTSNLSNYYAHGFTPNITAITNSSGEWSGLIWTTPSSAEDAVGDYDIIVDIGSPTTPDGIIHFNFSDANVMDGIDGRTKPGFMVTDDGIDVVMAEQASAEAQLAEIHQ